MKQQINLYTPKIAAARDFWSLPSAVMLVILVTVVAAFLSWGASQYADAKLATLMALQVKEAALHDQIRSLEKQRTDLRADPAIIQEQKRIKAKIGDKRELAKMLHRMQPGVANMGFSPFLFGLADARRSGVWFTVFELDLAQQKVTLNGVAGKADDVPLLIKDLGETPAFSAMQVTDFSLSQKEKTHEFTVLANVGVKGGADER